LRPERPEDRGRVGRRHRPAPRAPRSDQTHVAVLLDAEADRLPPLVGLVVVVAARIDAHVATERARVPELRGRDDPGGAGGAGARRSSALRTFSGVMGTSSIRTPTAS